MLTEVIVENLGVLERAELELDGGCTALTGETGAGKTLLVVALGLLLGGRADRSLVREGARRARIQGRFVVPSDHRAVRLLDDLGLVADRADDYVEIVLARSVDAEGKSRARVNGSIVTNSVLASAGAALVEIAGQHAATGIGSPSVQRGILDANAGAVDEASEVAAAVRSAVGCEREFEQLASSERERERELDILRFEIEEIDAAKLREGEAAELGEEVERLEHAEAIALALGSAVEALKGEGGAGDLVGAAERDATLAAEHDAALGEAVDRLAGVAVEITDIADELARRTITPDPDALEQTRTRLTAIARLRRKYGDNESEILAYHERARARAAELEGATSALEELRGRRDAELERARELAASLGRRRAEAAAKFGPEIEAVLGGLALTGARFEVRLTERELYEGGSEGVEFLVSANPGEATRPLAKVASGGELARLALALHLLARPPEGADGGRAHASTMVFDEIDAGVGGRAAQAVGRALAGLARESGAQVLVVTHLPQVAAFADNHYRVIKEPRDERANEAGRSVARLERVDSEERIDELSRMLAGMPESSRAREHARELLDIASEMVAR
jgi:DNA repair protein RecN (Recombination protein N)